MTVGDVAHPRRFIGVSLDQAAAGGTLALQVDAEGNVRYDAIAQHGRRAGTSVHTSHKGEFLLGSFLLSCQW